MMQQGGKKTPGEGEDDVRVQPLFAETGIIGPNDYKALPSTGEDLRDPLMSAAITHLGAILGKTSQSGRAVNRQEKEALEAVSEKLDQLKTNLGEAPSWIAYIERCMEHIRYILGNNPSE
jgi:hypothetical protein